MEEVYIGSRGWGLGGRRVSLINESAFQRPGLLLLVGGRERVCAYACVRLCERVRESSQPTQSLPVGQGLVLVPDLVGQPQHLVFHGELSSGGRARCRDGSYLGLEGWRAGELELRDAGRQRRAGGRASFASSRQGEVESGVGRTACGSLHGCSTGMTDMTLRASGVSAPDPVRRSVSTVGLRPPPRAPANRGGIGLESGYRFGVDVVGGFGACLIDGVNKRPTCSTNTVSSKFNMRKTYTVHHSSHPSRANPRPGLTPF